jgi:hypothetical protein
VSQHAAISVVIWILQKDTSNPTYGICYWLRFPPLEKIGEVDGPLKLVFASVIGKVELEFAGR